MHHLYQAFITVAKNSRLFRPLLRRSRGSVYFLNLFHRGQFILREGRVLRMDVEKTLLRLQLLGTRHHRRMTELTRAQEPSWIFRIAVNYVIGTGSFGYFRNPHAPLAFLPSRGELVHPYEWTTIRSPQRKIRHLNELWCGCTPLKGFWGNNLDFFAHRESFRNLSSSWWTTCLSKAAGAPLHF
jgi:hypothetical protein